MRFWSSGRRCDRDLSFGTLPRPVPVYHPPGLAPLRELAPLLVQDAELIDFFQNAPIALHWLSGTGHVMWANQARRRPAPHRPSRRVLPMYGYPPVRHPLL